jgi:F0F1-type ATP synthase membrane subunit b/b'
MAEQPGPQSPNLDDMMRQLGARPKPAVPQPARSTAAPPPVLDWNNVSVNFLNQHWNLSVLDLRSKRRSFAWAMTWYKRLLALVLRPFINVILFRQAEYNEHVAALSSKMWTKLMQHEGNLYKVQTEAASLRGQVNELMAGQEAIARLQTELNGLETRIADRLRQRKEDQQRREEKFLALLRKEAETSVENYGSAFRQQSDEDLDSAIENAILDISRKVQEVRREIRRVEKDMQARLNERMKALTEALLESVGDGEEFSDLTSEQEKKG